MEPLDLIPSAFSWAALWTDGTRTLIEWATSRADAISRLAGYRDKPGVCLVARVHPPGAKAVVALDGTATHG